MRLLVQLLNLLPGGSGLRGFSPAMKERDLRAEADRLVGQGRHAEAVPLYRKLAEEFPEEESHLLSLAWALYDSGRSEEAAGWFEVLFARELKRGVFTGFAYDELVRLYCRQGNWPALLLTCQKAAAAKPDDPSLLTTLAEAYLKAGRPDEAARVFEELLLRDAEAPSVWCALGNARLAAGDEKAALTAYEQAARIDKDAAPTFFSRLAAAFLARGNPRRAKEAMERSVALRPKDPLYAAQLGDILVHLGETKAAFAAYEKAEALQPGSSGALWHRLGRLLEGRGMAGEAAAAYERALDAEPENGRYALALAAAHLRAGKPELAAAALKAVEKDS